MSASNAFSAPEMSFVAALPRPVGVLSDALRRVVAASLFTGCPFFCGLGWELCSTCGRWGEVSRPQRALGQNILLLRILLLLPDLPIPEAIDDVIVHHSNRLHVRIS